MCTLTLHRTPARTLLTMNRDEARNRAPELPPREHVLPDGHLRWLAPCDSARSGTWIGVNALGAFACVMNGNVPLEETIAQIAAGAPSRGELPGRVLSQGALEQILRWLRDDFVPQPYPAFMLLVGDMRESVLFTWDGRGEWLERSCTDAWTLLVSSQLHVTETLQKRTAAFKAWREAGEALEGKLPSYHLMQKPGETHWTPMMSRDISCTRSITQIVLEAGQNKALMRYGAVEDGSVGLGDWLLELEPSVLQ